MEYSKKEAKVFFEWFENRDFDYIEKSKNNYMMEAFISGYKLANSKDK